MPEIQGVEYITAIQVAKRLGVARQTVYRWIEAGRFNGIIDLGGTTKTRYLIPVTALEGFTPPTYTGNQRGRPTGKASGKD